MTVANLMRDRKREWDKDVLKVLFKEKRLCFDQVNSSEYKNGGGYVNSSF